jgi:ectoine hydroxylase-related dioxygenase (phytanoyl-CoA dioxygenase family)
MEVVSRYLGYTPNRADIWMFWSFAGTLTDDERRNVGQTIDYHFDVHGYNFAYAAYYLTDTDRRNGAHQMVCGSHQRKPFKWLLGSAKQSDGPIESFYGKEKVLTIEGPAGTGFWQDSSCYHKALAPQIGRRLLLQARYF